MIEQLQESFAVHFGANGAAYAAPGRVNLIGEHTDYNLGFVLPGAIDKKIFLVIAPNHSRTCRIWSMDFKEMAVFNIDDLQLPEMVWARYIYGEIKELEKLGKQVEGFNAVLASTIPIGAGLSSSAAFTSVFGVALNDLFDMGLTRLELAKAGQACEHHYAGVLCGIMDQFASLHGSEGQVMRLDCRSLEYEYVPFNPSGLSLLLIDTQVKHSLASSEYNVRRKECEEGLAQLQKAYSDLNSLRDVSLDQLTAHRKELSLKVYNRCSYVVEENERVLAACAALTAEDYRSFGAQMFGSHEGLSKKYEVSCAELDFLQETARNYRGILGSRMMGGGFGGCTINLLQDGAVDSFISDSSAQYTKRFWKELHPIRVSIGPGAGKL